MIDARPLQLLEAVAQAARRHRAAMRRYIVAQAWLLDAGMPMDVLMYRNRKAFVDTATAEEAQYDASLRWTGGIYVGAGATNIGSTPPRERHTGDAGVSGNAVGTPQQSSERFC